MDWLNLFLSGPATTGDLRALGQAQAQAADRIRAQIRRSASAQADSFDSLAQENRELRLYLTAIVQLLVEKGLLRTEEIQAKMIALLPPLPPPAPGEDNPFAELGR